MRKRPKLFWLDIDGLGKIDQLAASYASVTVPGVPEDGYVLIELLPQNVSSATARVMLVVPGGVTKHD